MNFRIAATICLAAWTAAAGFCQGQLLTDTPEAQQTTSAVEKNQPAESESRGLADTLFRGEWKLNSTKLIFDGVHSNHDDFRHPKPKSGWIRDGILNINDHNVEYEVVRFSDSKATIACPPDSPQQETIEIRRTTYLLFVTIPVHQQEAAQSPDSNNNVESGLTKKAVAAEPPHPEGMILEFWRVDPSRQAVVERLEFLSNLMTELETSGDAVELQKARQESKEATAALRKMDTAPEIASLRNEILLARKSGDHIRADSMENKLAKDFAKSTAETKTKGSDTSAQQDLLKQITATKLELDEFKHSLGENHPKVIEAKRKLASLQSLFDQNATNSPAPQHPTKSRAQLEQTLDQLLIKYNEAELRARDIATARKPADKTGPMNQRLTQAVRAAFDLQQQLQEVRLQLAGLDLRELRAKHERRTALADKIIERRTQQLQEADELFWSGSSHSGSQTQNGVQTKSSTNPLSNTQRKNFRPDPDLLGEWTLVQASVKDFLALEANTRLLVNKDGLQFSRLGQQARFKLFTQTATTPHQIDLLDETNILNHLMGIYKIEADVLTIAWSAHGNDSGRPSRFLSDEGNVQIWKRIEPLPVFETPQQLLAYYDSAMNSGHPNFDKLARLLTDDEADRFAGFLIAAGGMMNRMMPVMMLAQQMGGAEDGAPSMASLSQISNFLNNAIAPSATPESIQAFQELTKPDMSFMTGQVQLPMTDVDAFSQKLKLAGQAVGDSRFFVVQLMSLMEQMSTDSKPKNAKADWVVTKEGDKAIAVNQTPSGSDNEIGSGVLELERKDGTWVIAKVLDDDALKELAVSATGGIVGTDEDGNKIPIGALFGAMAETTVEMNESSGVRAVEAPTVVNNVAPYTRISANDIGTTQIMTDETDPLTKSEVVGKYLTQRLSRSQRITRDILVDEPTSEEIVNAYIEEGLAGQEVFLKRGFPPRSYPQSYQSTLDLPYDYDPEYFLNELPDWSAAYLAEIVGRLDAKENNDWNDADFRILWSLEPLVFHSSKQLKIDLQPLATLLKIKFPTVKQFRTNAAEYSALWHSDLVMGMYVRLNGELPNNVFDLLVNDKETTEQLELLRTMCANKADFKWIDQEQVRLEGLLQKSPMSTLRSLVTANWSENPSLASHWLYALSTKSQYRASRSSPSEDCPPPVDPVLLVEAMKSLAGKSEATDEHIATFLEEAHPGRAFSRHLNDLLSSKLSYRDAALEALTQIYQKTSNQRLKAAIKKVAPGAAIGAI